MDAIWILLEGQRHGPYPPAQAAVMLAAGIVPADADVWWPPAGAWVKARELHPADEVQPVGAAVGVTGSVGAAWAVPEDDDPATALGSSGEVVSGGTAAVTVPTANNAPAASCTVPVRYLPRRLPTEPHHRHRPHLPTPERPQHVGGPDAPNAWAFTTFASGIAALSVFWWSPLTGVAMAFSGVALTVGAGVLVLVPRGEPGRRMAVFGLVSAVLAVALTLTLSTIVGSTPADEPVATAAASSPVKIMLGQGVASKATTVVQAQVFNSGGEAVDGGLFTVEATLNGSVLAQATQPLPPLAPGASGTARVVFLESLPHGTEYRVTHVATLPL